MKLIYCTTILVLCLTTFLPAQEDNQMNAADNLIPPSLQQIANNIGQNALLSTITNQANIEQVGNYNKAFITQNSGANNAPNFASIVQTSDNNTASITQSGNGNSNTIRQDGSGNEAIVNVNGNNNTSGIVQYGNGNVSLQNIVSNNKNYLITQEGNNNVIQRYDTELSPKALIISQKGNGMRLIINGSNFVK